MIFAVEDAAQALVLLGARFIKNREKENGVFAMKYAKSECGTGAELSVSDAPLPGYSASRLNAVQHGILSRHTVLPWEDADEYQALLESLILDRKSSYKRCH